MQVKQGLSAVLNLRGTVAVASASQDARTHGGGGESQAGVGTKGGLRRRKAEVEGGARRRHAGGCPVEEKKKRKKAGRARQSKQATVGCVSCVCDAWVAGVMVSFPPGWRLLGSGRVPSVAGKLAVDPGAGHASTAHHDVLAAINTLRPSSSLPTLPTLSTLSLPPASRPSPQTTCIARRPPEKKLRLRQCRVPRPTSAVLKHTPRHAPLPPARLHPPLPHLLRKAPLHPVPRLALAPRQAHHQSKRDLGRLGAGLQGPTKLEKARHHRRQPGPQPHSLRRMGSKNPPRSDPHPQKSHSFR